MAKIRKVRVQGWRWVARGGFEKDREGKGREGKGRGGVGWMGWRRRYGGKVEEGNKVGRFMCCKDGWIGVGGWGGGFSVGVVGMILVIYIRSVTVFRFRRFHRCLDDYLNRLKWVDSWGAFVSKKKRLDLAYSKPVRMSWHFSSLPPPYIFVL